LRAPVIHRPFVVTIVNNDITIYTMKDNFFFLKTGPVLNIKENIQGPRTGTP